MRIIDYHSIHGTEQRDGYIAIPGLDRDKSSVAEFRKLSNLEITLTRPTAFIYVDGFSVSQAEAGLNDQCGERKMPILRSGSSYIAHEWLYRMKGRKHIKHVNIVSSTCAAGIQALWEANNLLHDVNGEIEEVIIIGGERTTPSTIRLFKELRIPVTCGDGFVFIRIGSGGFDITQVNWKFAFNNNPFQFKKEDIDTLAPGCRVGYVKLHGTGTPSNTEAESGLAELGTPLEYKSKIGHTQGVSALLETCMVLDDPKLKGRILVTANGLGGFYGSFLLTKSWNA
ncbi:MAG: hypothetical protein GY820_10520 [Gammaproteobacteria bacterium]|nr:hypothetical protein [Gammaproteobacteria bacterium]